MFKAYVNYWKGYVDFKGRTSVGGYWWAVLANMIVSFVISILDGILSSGRPEDAGRISLTFMCLCMLPSLTIVVRRLRDAGYKWPNIFWSLMPMVGFIIMIIKLCKATDSNSYQAVVQPVSDSGAPVYRTYSNPQPTPYATPTAPPVASPTQPIQQTSPMPIPQMAASGSPANHAGATDTNN